jgi:hypothetical protein
MQQTCEGRIIHTKLWSENLKIRDHLEDLGIDGILEKMGGKIMIEFIWLRIGTTGGLL